MRGARGARGESLVPDRQERNEMSNAKFWTGICYPENMIPDWQDRCGDILQIPFAYCIHDKDLLKDGDETRKVHVHFELAFKNTTTYNHALNTLMLLSLPGKQCINKVEAVINVRHMYDYLIHDTEDARKAGKHLYQENERIERNNFDIGIFEQIDLVDEIGMLKELCDLVLQFNWTNFVDLYKFVATELDTQYFKVLKANQHFLEAMTRGNYLKEQEEQRKIKERMQRL